LKPAAHLHLQFGLFPTTTPLFSHLDPSVSAVQSPISQVGPVKLLTQVQAHFDPVPVAVPPLAHISPLGPVVQGAAVSQLLPIQAPTHEHPQDPVSPITFPPF
jgi:hypothetical protein